MRVTGSPRLRADEQRAKDELRYPCDASEEQAFDMEEQEEMVVAEFRKRIARSRAELVAE